MTRRPAKKKPALNKKPDTLDESLALVASYMADERAAGWFSQPWRHGKNAVLLALEAAIAVAKTEESFDFDNVDKPSAFEASIFAAWRYLQDVLDEKRTGSYLDSGEHMAELLFADDPVGKLTCAALRCHQLWVTSADGSIANLVLDKALVNRDQPVIANLVREARALDAIGTFTMLENDGFDELRRAFTYFWENGMPTLAYALKRLGQPT